VVLDEVDTHHLGAEGLGQPHRGPAHTATRVEDPLPPPKPDVLGHHLVHGEQRVAVAAPSALARLVVAEVEGPVAAVEPQEPVLEPRVLVVAAQAVGVAGVGTLVWLSVGWHREP